MTDNFENFEERFLNLLIGDFSNEKLAEVFPELNLKVVKVQEDTQRTIIRAGRPIKIDVKKGEEVVEEIDVVKVQLLLMKMMTTMAKKLHSKYLI